MGWQLLYLYTFAQIIFNI